MIRALRSFDLPLLLASSPRLQLDEVRGCDRLWAQGGGISALLPMLRDWRRRETLVHTRRGMIDGLVSARTLGGPMACEVDRLLLSPSCPDTAFELLEGVAAAAARRGVERLFLRLPTDSPLVASARRAGFGQYAREFLYRYSALPEPRTTLTPLGLRPRSQTDEYALFRLYSLTVPVSVRTVEGMTLEEWRQSREPGGCFELVYQNGSDLAAWLRLRNKRSVPQFDLVLQESQTCPGCLVEYAVSLLNSRTHIFCRARDYQTALRTSLEERGFTPVRQDSCMAKQLASRVRQPQMVPIQA